MLYRSIKYCVAALAAASLLAACTKLSDSYKDFVKDGEIYYPGRADSLTIAPGRNRILLTWLLISDPKITKTTLYWHNKGDSIVIPVQRSAGTDTIRKMLDPLAEGTYTFEIYTYDDKGHRSVSTSAFANSYGANYNVTLVNRPLRSYAMKPTTDTALLQFYAGSSTHIGVDVRYKNSLGDSIFMLVPKAPDSASVNLPKFIKGQYFKYRTLYKPKPNAIDTFYAEYEVRQVP